EWSNRRQRRRGGPPGNLGRLHQQRVLHGVGGDSARIIRFDNRQVALREPIAGRGRRPIRNRVGSSGLKTYLRNHAGVNAAHELGNRYPARKRTIASSGNIRRKLWLRLIKVEPAAKILQGFGASGVDQRLFVRVVGLATHVLRGGIDSPLCEIRNRHDLVASATKERVGTEQRNLTISRAFVVLDIRAGIGGVAQIGNHRVESSEKYSHV